MSHGTLPGEISCLSAAALWAFTVAMFRGPIDRFGARTVNLAKCAIASVLLALTLVALGRAGVLRAVPARELLLVGGSGLVGLTVGDTALFASVRALGPYRALLLQTLAPVFTAVLAFAWQGERLDAQRFLGMALTLGGVALVVAPRSGDRTRDRGSAGRTAGIVLGVVAAIGQGAGIVLAKEGMATMPPLHASFVRLAAAAAGLAAVGALDGTLRRSAGLSRARADLVRVVPAAILGSYLGIFLMMFGVGHAPASVAAVLLSTTPVMSLLLDAARGRERLTLRSIAGTGLALTGVGVLTTRG